MAQASFNGWIKEDIGLNTNVRVNHMRRLGLSNWDDLSQFEENDIKILCGAARKEQPPFPVNVLVEKRLKIACYGAKIYESIGRQVDRSSLSINRMKDLMRHKEIVENHEDDTAEVPKVS